MRLILDTNILLSDAAVADILEQSDCYQEQSGGKLQAMGAFQVPSALLFKTEA